MGAEKRQKDRRQWVLFSCRKCGVHRWAYLFVHLGEFPDCCEECEDAR